jgi:formylglycine-generating enzyme required for sulfatase activity
VKGSFAYIVYDTGALEVVDFSDPTQPVIKGKLKIFDESPQKSFLIELQGDRLYAFNKYVFNNQSYGYDSSLIVIDVGNPTAPRRIGNEKYDISDARSICVFGNSVYIAEIADLNGGVLVHRIDVSDPVSPLKKEVWGMSRSEVFLPSSIRVVGDLLYLAHGNGVSVSDLRETRYHKMSLFKTLGTAHDIKIFDDYICVADGGGGLQILSPSPAMLGQPTPIDADRIRIRVQGGLRSRMLIESSGDLRNWEPDTYRASLIPSEITVEKGGEARFYRALKGPQGFVWIEPGQFMMGSPLTEQGRRPDEVQHPVTLTQGFWMSDHEVTVGEFSKNGNTWPAFVTWEDAVKYCEELTQRERVAGRIGANQVYRLPTEAEWEYAARAGTTGPRYAETNSLGVLWKDVRPALRSVMLDDPNPWGLYDMIGNASEWCSDWYAEYPAGPVTDPTGPESGWRRVIRGQGLEGELFEEELFGLPSPQTFRSAERWIFGYATGFRVVLSTVPIR